MPDQRRFTTTVTTGERGRVMVPVPFDPSDVWGPKPVHHLTGTVDGKGVRAVLEPLEDGFAFKLGAA